MATYNEIVFGAMSRLGLVQGGRAPSGDEYEFGLDQLNKLVLGWNNQGVVINYSRVSADDGGDETPFDDEDLGAIEDNLALRLASAFGRSTTRQLVIDAAHGFNALYAKYGTPTTMGTDTMLLPSRQSGLRRRLR